MTALINAEVRLWVGGSVHIRTCKEPLIAYFGYSLKGGTAAIAAGHRAGPE
jgi:hypothetical protein